MDWTKKKPVGGSKYGLQLKISAPAVKKPQLKKPVAFSLENDDEYTVEEDIARQASKKQSAHEVDVQIKQALEQDANAFDYDGVYDEMKGRQAAPIREDRAKREPKYIKKLIDKAKVRAVEHDMAYERRLTKEREKDDHLYGDKDTFVTSAYKKKMQEAGKWKEEERLRELREQAHEVSGKKDLSDFYRNLLKHNVAFGAGKEKGMGHPEAEAATDGAPAAEAAASSKLDQQSKTSHSSDKRGNTAHRRQRDQDSDASDSDSDSASPTRTPDAGHPAEENPSTVFVSNTETSASATAEQNLLPGPPEVDGAPLSAPDAEKKPKVDAVAAARERYLARKKQRNE